MAPVHPDILDQLRQVHETAHGVHARIHERIHDIHEDVHEKIEGAIKLGLGRIHKLFGFNDGCIYPPSRFPAGTPLSVMKAAALNKAPIKGDFQTLIVLVDFPDHKFSPGHDTAYFQDLFFGEDKNSVKQYYKTVTTGKMNFAGKVVGPFTLPNTMKYYANGDSGVGNSHPNASDMCYDAAKAAAGVVNYADFWNRTDPDQPYVESFVVIHAGQPAEATSGPAQTRNIWSHKAVFPQEFEADGVRVYSYLTLSEDSPVGVCAHELGHLVFGWPDFYDTDYSSQGLGDWCLMAGGSWNGRRTRQPAGAVPAEPNAWCKANQGWVQVQELQKSGPVTIDDVKKTRTVYKIQLTPYEYILLENRQLTGYDASLPGPGLMVYLVDERIQDEDDEWHPKVMLIQADGRNSLQYPPDATGGGDAGDPFPGSTQKTSLTSENPFCVAYWQNKDEAAVLISCCKVAPVVSNSNRADLDIIGIIGIH
eukprot:jgi/Botrbrau1/7949/Bobra.9_2s0107.1